MRFYFLVSIHIALCKPDRISQNPSWSLYHPTTPWNTVNQQMFAAINVCGLANQNISLLLMFAFLSWGELDGKLCFTKLAITPLIMVRSPDYETSVDLWSDTIAMV